MSVYNHLVSKSKQLKSVFNLVQQKKLHHASNVPFSQLGAVFNQRPVLQSSGNLSSLAPNETNNNRNQKNSMSGFKNLLFSLNLGKNLKKQAPVTGLFGINDLKHFEGFYKLQEEAAAKIDALTSEAHNYDLFSKQTNRNLVNIFDDISNELCRVADMAEFVRTSHPDINYRQAANLVI
jgi:hypothetical protein